MTEFVKSAGLFPAAEIFEMCIGVVPLLMMATVMGTLARPCVVTGKVTEVGINLRAGPGGESISVPISATDWGLPVALSVKINAASRTPTAEGARFVHNARGVGWQGNTDAGTCGCAEIGGIAAAESDGSNNRRRVPRIGHRNSLNRAGGSLRQRGKIHGGGKKCQRRSACRASFRTVESYGLRAARCIIRKDERGLPKARD